MRFAIAIAALCAACLGAAQAQEWSPPDRSFVVELPTGWTQEQELAHSTILRVSAPQEPVRICSVMRELHDSVGLPQSEANALVAEMSAADLVSAHPENNARVLSFANEMTGGTQVASGAFENDAPAGRVHIVTRRFIVARYYAAFEYVLACAAVPPMDQSTVDTMNAFVASLRFTQIEATP